MRLRPARAPLVVAWVVVLAVVGYLATHPSLWTPVVSRLAGRHLLRQVEGNIRFRDFRWRFPGGLDLYRASLTLRRGDGGLLIVAADTLSLDFRPIEIARTPTRLRRVVVRGGEVYLSQEEPDGGGAGTGGGGLADLPASWPQLRIDRLEIRDAQLEVSGPDGRLRERIPRLAWTGSVAADSTLRLGTEDAEIWWQSRGSRLEDVAADVEIGRAGVRVRRGSLLLNGRPVEGGGRLAPDGDLDLVVEGRDATAGEIENLLDLGLGFAARGDVGLVLGRRGDSLSLDLDFDGELEGHRLRDAHGLAVLTPGRLQWSELTGVADGATFRGRGDFDLRDPDAVSFVLTGEADDIDVSAGLVPGAELPPTGGHGSVTIRHDARRLRTRVTGVIADGFLQTLPFDTCRVDLTAGTDSVWVDRLDLAHGRDRARLRGRLDAAREFDGELALDLPDLDDLPPGWRLEPARGAGAARGRLSGPLDALRFAGEVSWRDLALGPLAAGTGVASVQVEGLPDDPRASFHVSGRDLRIGGVPVGEYRGAGTASRRGAGLRAFQASRGDTAIGLRLEAAFADSGATVGISRFTVDLEGVHWELPEAAVLTVRPGRLSLPELRLVSDQGSLIAGGSYERDRRLDLELSLRSFDLQLVDLFLRGQGRLRGLATADLSVSGDPSAPEAELVASVTDADLALARVDSLGLTAALREGRLEVRELVVRSEYGRVRAAGVIRHPGAGPRDFWPGAELELEAQVAGGDWAFLEQFQLPALDRLAGRFDAALVVAGTTDAPLITGRVASAPFHIHWLHLESLTGNVAVDRHRLALTDLHGRQGALAATARLELPLDFDLLGALDTPLDGPFLLEVTIPPGTDLEPLARATNAFIETSGRGQGRVTVAGPLAHPLWRGRIATTGAGFVLKGLGEIYHDVSLEGTFAGDVLSLTRVEGREGARGRISGTGSVRFRGLELDTFDLRARLDRFLVASIPDLRVLVRSDDFALTGARVGPDSLLVPRFTGHLEVQQGRYTGDFSERPTVSDPRLATVSPDWLADLRVVAPPRSVRVLNRAMELSMSGDVNVVRDEGGLSLRGSLDIDTGRLPVFNNDFKVVRGRIDFSREVGFDPRAEIEAETTVRVRDPDYGGTLLERITVTVSGRLYEPTVSFSSESGYSRQGIERMLLGLSPYAGDPRTAGGLRTASIAAGFNLLEREIAAALNVVDTFDIEQVEREQDGQVAVVPLIGVGKYLGQDLYVKYAQGLSNQPDRDLLIEYQITDHLLLQSEVRRRLEELQGETTYSLDLKYRFEY